MLKVQGIVTKHCQTWKKLIPTVKIWGKKLGSSKRNMLSCAKTKLPQAEQTMKQQQRKKESVITTCLYEPWNITQNALFFFSSCEQIRSRHPGCLSLFLFLYSIQIMSVVLLWSYDWSSAPIVNLTEQATHVPNTRVLTSVNSNQRFILPSLTHTFLFNKYKKLN